MMKTVKGWMLNGQMPTGDKVQVQWKDITINASVVKYSFLKGLDFDSTIEVFDTSEKGAWEQLAREIKGA
jgi:hypothetical protein